MQFRTLDGEPVEIELTPKTAVYDAGKHREIAITVKDQKGKDVPGWAKVYETMAEIRAAKPSPAAAAAASRAKKGAADKTAPAAGGDK